MVGLVGDGAFIKGNRPFKDQLDKLLNKNLTYRWDLLHLVNRAHVPARGTSELEKEKEKLKVYLSTDNDDEDIDDIDNFEDTDEYPVNSDLRIPKTIGYIQVR